MSTPILFHGPTARDQTIKTANEIGRIVAEIGDGGLKVDDSRALVILAGQGSVGDRRPVAIVGPVDLATPEAADALLKTLEDLVDGPLQIILWTDHLSTVSSTIKSRTRSIWCPPVTSSGWNALHAHMALPAKRLCEALLAGDVLTIIAVLEEASVKDERSKKTETLLDAVAAHLASLVETEQKSWLDVWERLREALGSKWLDSRTATLAVFLGEGAF